ncbi:uncharacterized protein N7515_008542 [Penicillium bovifimosum]|uniref:MFS maltose permease n=1 Tax=Penicillium bovifimosum TaxID=126998 RepID=A0A9W9GNI2_9EURO|nr:uncharacterized protein N7515_008542 [Penicillium bovifimosum]KAJ5124717.1 hypothetical protein N7515_008542 [Penicillium bovifimosum]
MLPPRSAVGRIPAHVRPTHSRPNPNFNVHFRPFTHRTRLLLLSPAPGRPQLPFLSPLAPTRPLPPLSIHLRQHFGRLISTESREHYKRRASRGLKIGLSVWGILVLFSAVKLGVYQENIEHSWPTPPEWTWKSRWCLRSAQALQNPEQIGKLMTNWPMVAGYLRELLERLENLEGEGKGLVEQDEGGFLVEGIGRTGFDISAKSEPWRRGYFQALMGAAKAAENLDGWLTDRKQKISAPAEYVVGPSNPRPKPMPAGQKKIPREEDCEPASPSPESFYMKVLTTKGFNTGQKLDAALAYADWLDFKGLGSTAGDMYTWALDIAASGLEGDASKIVDLKTGLLKNNNGDLPSENILRVSTALAVHNARQENLPAALSLFTSVLKARRSLPLSSEFGTTPSPPSFPGSASDPFTYMFKSLKNVLVPVDYPAPLPSGDQPPRRTTASACDEAGLMTYIGEIIYASSSKESGLAWTRDAVDMAELTLHQLSNSTDQAARTRCAQCLKVGLENWKTMVHSLVTRAWQEEQQSKDQAKSSWFGGERRAEAKSLDRRRWEAENAILEDRIRRLFPLLEGESGLDLVAPNSSLFV